MKADFYQPMNSHPDTTDTLAKHLVIIVTEAQYLLLISHGFPMVAGCLP